MKKRIMVVGPTQSGKSSLTNVLNDSNRPLKKTQDIIYGKNTIDTPGSYIENPSMYKYLIATAQEQLKKIGIKEPYFSISLQDNRGVEALKQFLLGKQKPS